MPGAGAEVDGRRQRPRRDDRGAAGAGAEVDGEPRFRLSGRAALWLPVIVSFAVQVPATVWLWRWRPGTGGGLSGPPPWLTDTTDTAAAPGPVDDTGAFALRLALALAGPLVLLLARRFPGPVVTIVTVLAGVYTLVVAGATAPPYVALLFAIVGAVVRGARVWAIASVAGGWAVTLGAGIVLGVPWQAAPVVAVTLALALAVVVGESIRNRRARFDEARRRAAERRVSAVQAERMRIARELHDVLAHSLSQINVQAAVGAHLADRDPAQAKAALVTIKEASKAALDEVRSVLGVLRDETQDARAAAPLVPEPGLAELPALLAPARAQGLPVSLEWRLAEAGPVGTAQPDARAFHRVPQTVQLAAYRIVQESLTNARRHAAGSEVRVSLSLTDDRCVVRVANGSPAGADADRPEEEDEATTTTGADAGAGAGEGAASPGPGGGRGLIGMRERAELLGGSFEAGPGAGGGFLVQAILPFTAGGHPEPGRGPGTGGRA